MIKSLEEIQLPQLYIDIVKDVYKGSFIQVICGKQLTRPTTLQIGIKTVRPWSAVNFIIAINWVGEVDVSVGPRCVSLPRTV